MHKIWIFACGEPHEIDDENVRLHRAGKIAKFLSEKKLKKVKLFTSTFDHVKKINRFKENKVIKNNNNLETHFLKTIPYKKNISIIRLISNFFLGIRLYFYLKKFKEQPDLIFIAFPPIETSLACILFSKKRGIKTIIDVRDLWPEVFVEGYSKYLKSFLKYFLLPYRIMTKYVFKNTFSLMSISKKMLNWSQNYAKRNNIFNDNFVPFSYIDSSKFKVNETETIIELKKKIFNKFNITLIGNVTKTIKFNDIYDAASKLKNNDEIKFVICGAGDNLEQTKLKCQNLKNIIFTGWINQNEIQFILRNTKIGLIPYRNDVNLSNAMPNKFSEYMSFGIPILTSLSGSVSEILNKEKIGIQYSSDSLDLYNKILDLYNNESSLNEYSKNSKNLFLRSFEESINHDLIFNFFEKVYAK